MKIFTGVLTRVGLLLVAGGLLVACEEEPQMQRPVDPPPSKPAENKDDPPKADEAGPGEAAKADPAPTGKKRRGHVPPSRVPTASQLLGLGGGADRAAADALPRFIRPRRDGERSALFDGEPVGPSQQYASMRGEVLDVSPLERHWGATDELTEEARRRKLLMSSMAAPDAPGATRIFGGEPPPTEGAEEPKTDGATAPAGDGRGFHLVMYRLNPKTGAIETFDRKYATEAAMAAARRFAAGQGYQETRPTEEDVKKARGASEARKPEPKPSGDGCLHKAQWVESGIQQTRCFPTQEALNAFTQARLAEMKKANEPAKPAPKQDVQPDGGIQPVKIGQ